MTVRFDRTPEHWSEANIAYLYNTDRGRALCKKSGWMTGAYSAVVAVLTAMLLLFAKGLPVSVLGWIALATALIGFVVGVLLTPYFLPGDIRKKVLKAYRKGTSAEFFGPKTITVREDGLQVRSDSGEQVCFWKTINDVVVHNGYILFLIGTTHLMEIPVSAFSSPQHQAEFLEQVTRYRSGEATQKQAWYQSRDQVGDE